MQTHHTTDAILSNLGQELDVEAVIALLGAVIKRADSPVARECLRDARAEIAFLTSTEGKLEDFESDEYLDKKSEELEVGHDHDTELEVA
jgi:hypothetical protein